MSDPGWVTVLETGGTIASRRDVHGVSQPAGATPEFGRVGVDVRIVRVMSGDSSTFDFAAMDRVVDAVADALAEPRCRGVVVLHGTDTLEETALAVDLCHADARPVVFTGAQRTADHPDSDGPANAAAAVVAAADAANRGRGVLVAFGGRLLPARGVRKVHTTDLDAFHTSLQPRQVVGRRPLAGFRVDVVALYPGADGLVIDALVEAGTQGIILEAMGSGNANIAVVEAVRRAVIRGVTVVVTTRVPFGSITASYGGGGGGADLVSAGATFEPRLRAGQARLALASRLAVAAQRHSR